MKKFLIVLSAFMLLLGLSGVAGAFSIDYGFTTGGTGPNKEFFSPYEGSAGFFTETFDVPLWTWSGNGQIKTGSDSTGAAPAGVGGTPDASKYVAVPKDYLSSTTFTATGLGGFYNYLGLWWGSVDWDFNNIYNEIRFFNGINQVETVTGFDVGKPDANGNWTAPNTNLYVNINNLPTFDSFTMYSNKYAFEADNMTVGTVPEPTTMLLLGLGLLGVAAIRRKI